MGYIIAMIYELHNGYGFYNQKEDIRYKIKEEQKEMIDEGYLFVDSIEGYFQTTRKNMACKITQSRDFNDSFSLSAIDALIIAKATLYQLYDINDIEAYAPYTISEDDSTYFVCGTLSSLPNHLAGKSQYTNEELAEVCSLSEYRPIYNVRIRKKDAKIIHVVKDI